MVCHLLPFAKVGQYGVDIKKYNSTTPQKTDISIGIITIRLLHYKATAAILNGMKWIFRLSVYQVTV